MVSVVHGRLTCADVEDAYHFYRASPELVALSRQSSAAAHALYGLEDIYGGKSDVEWQVDGGEGDTVTSGRRKELWSKFHRCRHLLLEWDELEISSFLNGLSDWLIVGARSGRRLLATQ